MVRDSVRRYRAAMLVAYVQSAIWITMLLSVLFYLVGETPTRGGAALACSLFMIWLRWRIRRSGELLSRHASEFVLAILLLISYGIWVSSSRFHLDVWMMAFPVVFAPVVAPRERILWLVTGVIGFVLAMLLRPEPAGLIIAFVEMVAYLMLGCVVMQLVRHNEQHIEQLAHLSSTDPVTRLYNRAYLMEVLPAEINRCRRNGQPLTVIMLDVDHFKMLNDDLGHLHGDSVLQRVAQALQLTARRGGDYVFRYGGEEFCVVTSGLGRDESAGFADKLCQAIQALGIENPRSPSRLLTASAGFWCVEDLSVVTPDELLENADQALYCAKAAGRNTVVDFAALPKGQTSHLQPQEATT